MQKPIHNKPLSGLDINVSDSYPIQISSTTTSLNMSPNRFSNASKSNKFKDDQKSKILKYLPIVNQWEREN